MDFYGLAQVNRGVGNYRAKVYDAVLDFGFVGDLLTTNGTSTVTGSALTDSTNPFTIADVGKRITLPFCGAGSGVNALQLTTTISAFVSSNQVTLAVGATNNRAGISVSYGTDNTNAINAMVTQINANNFGAKVFFPASLTNAYGFPISVVLNKTAQFAGIGSGHTADSGEYTKVGGTRLAWWGTSNDGGTAFQGFFTFNPTGIVALKRPKFSDLWFDCRNNDQNQALYAAKFASCHGAELESIYVIDSLATSLWLDVTATALTEAKDCTRFAFDRFCMRILDNTGVAPQTTPFTTTSTATLSTTPQSITVAANSMKTAGYCWMQTTMGEYVLANFTGGGGTTTLTGVTIAPEFSVHTPTLFNGAQIVECTPGNGSAGIFNGSTTANACCGTIKNGQVSVGQLVGPGTWSLWNSDLIRFTDIQMNGGLDTTSGGRKAKPGFRLNGSNVSNTLASRNIIIENCDPGGSPGGPLGGISIMALTNAGALLVAPSGPHKLQSISVANGAPLVTRESLTGSNTQGAAGAYFQWQNPNGGFQAGGIGPTAAAAQALTAAANNVIAGTVFAVPPQGFQVGLRLRFTLNLNKTGAGTANRVINLRYTASAANTGGTVIATISRATTGAIDNGKVVIEFVVTAIGGSATALADYSITKSLATAAGLDSAVATSALTAAMTMTGFDATLPNSGPRYLHLEVAPGTAEVCTVTHAYVECIYPGNP